MKRNFVQPYFINLFKQQREDSKVIYGFKSQSMLNGRYIKPQYITGIFLRLLSLPLDILKTICVYLSYKKQLKIQKKFASNHPVISTANDTPFAIYSEQEEKKYNQSEKMIKEYIAEKIKQEQYEEKRKNQKEPQLSDLQMNWDLFEERLLQTKT